MYLLEAGATYEVSIFTTVGPQTAINVRHYRWEQAGATEGQSDLALQALQANFATEFKACLSQDALYRGLGIRKVHPSVDTLLDYHIAHDLGVWTGQLMPKQTCGILTFLCAADGPSKRGRLYVPFPSEGANDDGGIPSGPYLEDVAALGTKMSVAFNYLVDAEVIGSLTPVVLGQAVAGVTTINGFVARPRWGTQRSRGDYGKLNPSPI